MTIERDTNPTMTTGDATSIWRRRVAPMYGLTGNFGADVLRASLGGTIERSTNSAVSMNRNDPTMSAGWQHETEIGGYGLSLSRVSASSRSTELTESGVVVADSTRTTTTVAGNWTAATSERGQLAANLQLSKVGYDISTLPNYRNDVANLTYSYAWNEQLEPFLRLDLSRYAPEQAGSLGTQDMRYRTLQAGVRYKVTEHFDVSAQAGTARMSSGATSGNQIWNLTARYAGERSALSVATGRNITTSGMFGVLKQNQTTANWSYAVDESTTGGLDYSRNRSQQTGLDSSYRQATVWVSRQFSPFWSARLSAARRERLLDQSPTASGSLYGITLVFTHPDL